MTKFDREMDRFARHLERWAERTLEAAGFGLVVLAVNERLFSLYRGEFMTSVGDVIDATGGPIPPMLGGPT